MYCPSCNTYKLKENGETEIGMTKYKCLKCNTEFKVCLACNGSGYYDSNKHPKCSSCNGTGLNEIIEI